MKLFTRFVLLLASILIGILALLILVLTLFFIFIKRNKETWEGNIFQVSQITKNETSFGFVRLNKELVEEEYVSYVTGNGNLVIISNFAENEYECTGSCFCENDFGRRNAILSRGLFVFLSALSATVAMSIAKETFQNNCQQEFAGVCDEKMIKFEVENCEDKTLKETEESSSHQRRIYKCIGHCLPNKGNICDTTEDVEPLYGDEKNVLRAKQDFGDCTKLEITGKVEVVVRNLEKHVFNSNNLAKQEFMKVYLTPFCKKESQVICRIIRSSGRYFGKKNQKKTYTTFLDHTTSACGSTPIGHRLRHISCYLSTKELFTR